MVTALDEEKFSVPETARKLGVCHRTVTNYIAWGLLEAHRYSNRKQVITQSALDNFMTRTFKRSKLQQLDLFDENFFMKDRQVA